MAIFALMTLSHSHWAQREFYSCCVKPMCCRPVTAALTTDVIIELNKKVDVDGKDPASSPATGWSPRGLSPRAKASDYSARQLLTGILGRSSAVLTQDGQGWDGLDHQMLLAGPHYVRLSMQLLGVPRPGLFPWLSPYPSTTVQKD